MNGLDTLVNRYQVRAVQINNTPGEDAERVWELTINDPIGRNEPLLKTLRWQRDRMAYGPIYMGTGLGKDHLVGIAESMK